MTNERNPAGKPLRRILGLCLAGLLLAGLAAALIRPARPPRTAYRAEPFQGVTYERQAREAPRPLVIHVVTIDLAAEGIEFLVTPGDPASGLDLYARTTTDFVAEYGLQIAANAAYFEPFSAGTPLTYKPKSGDPVNVKGLAISDSATYSDDYADYPVLCLQGRQVEIRDDGCPAGTEQAVAGEPIFVRSSAAVALPKHPYYDDVHPRTAVALDAQGQRMWLIVVDGRQRNYSQGVSLAELAEITLGLGADTALNLDGGGSTTLVMAGASGPELLNAPIHTRIHMRERPVGNHLGVYALPAE